MPSFAPLTLRASGKLATPGVVQAPRRTKRSASLTRRATSSISAMAMSATQSFSTSGV